MLRNIYRRTRDCLIILIKFFLFLIPKNRRLIVANAWFGQKYADNTMYEYEYLLKYSPYKVVWTTRSKDVFNKLKKEGKPVVISNTFKGLWTQIRAKMLLSTIQENDFNKYFLCNCILLDLDHGIIYKQVGFDINPNDYQLVHDKIVKKYIRYYMTTPSYITEKMMEHSYHVNENNTILCGKARLDYFFDKTLRKQEPVLNQIIDKKKVIVYMPTHRSGGEKKINIEDILDLEFIESLCENYGYVFLIKKHFYHRKEITDVRRYKLIFDLTQETIDAQELLFNADILITDYSSCYIDYLLLDRPLVLYTYDLNEYLKTERNLFVSFEQLDIGYQPITKQELDAALKDIIVSTIDRYKENRDKAKAIYFDSSLKIGHSREEIYGIIRKLMNNEFHNSWECVKEREERRSGVKELIHSIKTM